MVGEDLQLIWLFKSSQLCLYYRNFQGFFFFFKWEFWAKSGYQELNLYFSFPCFRIFLFLLYLIMKL